MQHRGNTENTKRKKNIERAKKYWRISKDAQEMLRNAERGRGNIKKHQEMQKGVINTERA